MIACKPETYAKKNEKTKTPCDAASHPAPYPFITRNASTLYPTGKSITSAVFFFAYVVSSSKTSIRISF